VKTGSQFPVSGSPLRIALSPLVLLIAPGPPGAICYKPDMRKWMRDRFKRGKKTKEESSENKPAPLRPAYFDAEEPAAQAAPPVEPEPPAIDEQPDQDAAQQPPSGMPGDAQPRRRRRRGRGGRGRGRSQAARVPEADPPIESQPAESEPSSIPAQEAGPAAPVASRPPKGVVVLAIGLPGSGKSSWFKRHNITPLSTDLLRSLLFDDPTEQRFQDLVFSNLRSMLRARLIARRPLNYVDATNLTPHERHSWIRLAKDYGYEVQAVYFDVPLEVCLDRNQKRSRVVDEGVMRRMAEKMKVPTFDEGFSKITVVRVRSKPVE
jgi:predicted kinase